MDEFSWIQQLQNALGEGVQSPFGIGDDAAILPPLEGECVIATDLLIEDVHFCGQWSALDDIAFKLYAANASDMWAMGARIDRWLLSMSTPSAMMPADVDACVAGFEAAMAQWGRAPLVGGDTSGSPGPRMFAITMIGRCEAAPWRRDGFQAGDTLWVNGPLGLSAAGLRALQCAGVGARAWAPACVRQHLRPAAGARAQRPREIHGTIDISDGLSQDLMHIARASDLRVVIQHPLPGRDVLEALVRCWPEQPTPTVADIDAWQLGGGEDFVCVVGSKNAPGAGWHPIGVLQNGPPSIFDERSGTRQKLSPTGWDHFTKRPSSS